MWPILLIWVFPIHGQLFIQPLKYNLLERSIEYILHRTDNIIATAQRMLDATELLHPASQTPPRPANRSGTWWPRSRIPSRSHLQVGASAPIAQHLNSAPIASISRQGHPTDQEHGSQGKESPSSKSPRQGQCRNRISRQCQN